MRAFVDWRHVSGVTVALLLQTIDRQTWSTTRLCMLPYKSENYVTLARVPERQDGRRASIIPLTLTSTLCHPYVPSVKTWLFALEDVTHMFCHVMVQVASGSMLTYSSDWCEQHLVLGLLIWYHHIVVCPLVMCIWSNITFSLDNPNYFRQSTICAQVSLSIQV